MAQEKAKKGFFFYFGFFLLALIAAVLVIFVIMLFMPGKSILGLQYFANSKTTQITTTTPEGEEEGQKIDFANPNFTSVEIDAGYSEVYIQKNYNYKESGIYINNQSKGFVATKKANDFSYNVKIENEVLKITIREQNAFLYFSKNIKVILQISDADLNPFENMSIKIENSGLVNIGGEEIRGKSSVVSIGSLEVNNGGGGIKLSSMADTAYNNLTLSSQSGDITIVPGKVEAQNMSLEVGSQKLSATVLQSPNTIEIKSDKGTISVVSIQAKMLGIVKNAYITIGTVTGGVDFTNSPFYSSVVKISKIEQGGILASNARDTDFEIGELGGLAHIETSTGSIKIDGAIVSNSILKTTSGNISAHLSDQANNIQIETNKGRIDVDVPKVTNLGTMARISNESGETYVNLDITDSKYNLYFYYYGTRDESEPRLREFKFDNVEFNLKIGNLTNPLSINSTLKTENMIVFKCNKKISINLERR